MASNQNENHLDGKPIELIRVVEGKFELTAEAKSLLASIRKPLTVVGVIGPYRSGKSYLLNRLLGRQSGFDVGELVTGCTRGLWIWNKPIPHEDKTILLVDTEGLFDVSNPNPNYDKNIFCLTILLTSYMIFNSVGVIDQEKIRNLSLVTQLAKTIRTNPNDDQEETGENFDVHFPDLLWVVRDYLLEKNMTDSQYLESCLKLDRKLDMEANNIRSTIRDMFKKRDCFTIIRPSDSDDAVRQIARTPESELRPAFLERMNELTKKIFTEASVKQLYSEKERKVVNVDGPGFATLAEFLAKAFNEGRVPSIGGAWEMLCQASCQKGIDEALACYNNFMKQVSENFPLDSGELNSLHQKVLEDAMEVFHAEALGDTKEPVAKLSAALAQFDQNNALVGGLYFSLCQKNMEASQKLCEEWLTKNFDNIVKRSENKGFSSFEEYKSAVAELLKDYAKNAVGPACGQVLKAFKPALDSHEQQQVLAFQLDQTKKDLVTQTKQLEKMQIQLVEQHAEAKKFRENLEAAQTAHQKEITELISKKEKELEEVKKKVEQDEAKRRQEIELYIQQNQKDMAKMYEDQLKQMKEEATLSQKQTQLEIQAMRDRLSRELSESNRLVEQAASREKKIEQQIQYIPLNISPQKKLDDRFCGCIHTNTGRACRRRVLRNTLCHQHAACRQC